MCDYEKLDANTEYNHYLRMASSAFVYAMASEFDLANKLCAKMFKYADKYNDWHSNNSRHAAHTIQGIIFVKRGDLRNACISLLNSADVTGSPQLNSFGPNMFLAKLLIEANRHEAVIDYLNKVKSFWKLQKSDQWIEEIMNGKMPDFGANLVYKIAN